MQLYKFKDQDGHEKVGVSDGDHLQPLRFESGDINSLAELLESEEPHSLIDFLRDESETFDLHDVTLLPPIDEQEVWAAGVTYKRSKAARMEESEAAASCYDRVYVSDRPELFMKATPHRVVGPHEALRIRKDSAWNVPEPEVTLVLNSRLELVGYTIGNDMSSRDIEGENPLYLPQAKVYDHCCSLGPCITLPNAMPTRAEIGIRLQVRRDTSTVFDSSTTVDEMARSFEDLIHWLGRDNSFPNGAFLLTGTGIVPDSSFTLQTGDQVEITVDGIGKLSNSVVQSL